MVEWVLLKRVIFSSLIRSFNHFYFCLFLFILVVDSLTRSHWVRWCMRSCSRCEYLFSPLFSINFIPTTVPCFCKEFSPSYTLWRIFYLFFDLHLLPLPFHHLPLPETRKNRNRKRKGCYGFDRLVMARRKVAFHVFLCISFSCVVVYSNNLIQSMNKYVSRTHLREGGNFSVPRSLCISWSSLEPQLPFRDRAIRFRSLSTCSLFPAFFPSVLTVCWLYVV